MRLPPRFAADAMLGRLARWLRVLGFDTLCDASLPGIEQLYRAQAQGRILLTRNRCLLREMRPRSAFEVQGDDPLEQLRQIVTAMNLPAPQELFTRCMLDNAELGTALPQQGPMRWCPKACAAFRGRFASARCVRACTGRARTRGACVRRSIAHCLAGCHSMWLCSSSKRN